MELNLNLLTEMLSNFLPSHKITYAETEEKSIFGQSFSIAGVSVELADGSEVYGSSCSIDANPLILAGYECLERFVVKQTQSSTKHSNYCKFSISNGIALHQNKKQAKENALNELIERNEILKSWYFNSPIQKIPQIENSLFHESFIKQFEIHPVCFYEDPFFCVTGIFAFPKNDKSIPMYGFGCANNIHDSILKSKKEFLMRLGFLCEESQGGSEYDIQSGLYHQEYYMNPKNQHHLKEWLERGYNENSKQIEINYNNIKFHNLTPAQWKDGLYVYKAESPHVIPLFFGYPPKDHLDFPFRCDIPHPIT